MPVPGPGAGYLVPGAGYLVPGAVSGCLVLPSAEAGYSHQARGMLPSGDDHRMLPGRLSS